MYEIAKSKKEIVTAFIDSFVRHIHHTNTLVLAYSHFKVFEPCSLSNPTVIRDPAALPISGSFDLILGDFPIAVRGNPIPSLKGLNHFSALELMNSLQLMHEKSYGIFMLEPILLTSAAKRTVREYLQSRGFSIVAIFNAPDNFFGSYTSLRPQFVIVKMGSNSCEFVGELNSVEQAAVLADNFFVPTAGEDFRSGFSVSSSDFPGFIKWKVLHEIKALDTEYKEFSASTLGQVALEINHCRSGEFYEHKANTVYLPKIGTQSAVCDLNRVNIKHHNCFQIVCDPEKLNSEYLVAFFESRLGKLVIDSSRSQGLIQSISKSELSSAEIALPDLVTQQRIVSSVSKLKLIRHTVEICAENLAVRPTGSDQVLKQIDMVLNAVGELADPDRVKSVIRDGESKKVEFKETFSLDVRKQTKEKDVRTSTIKTIAAFLNSEGGVLLIGVNDAGMIKGIDVEVEKFFKADTITQSRDRFLLDFKNAVRTHIGEQFYPFIEYRLVHVDSKYILFIECESSPEAVYVDNKDFYVRTNPATDQLEGPKLVAYIAHHFRRFGHPY